MTNISDVVKGVIAGHHPCLFVSPHLDDAALSAGALMSHLAARVPVTVATVFTRPSARPYTHFAARFTASCGYADADELFAARAREDCDIAARLGSEPVHLGHIDAAWRRRHAVFLPAVVKHLCPELDHLYPGPLVHWPVARQDHRLIDLVAKQIAQLAASRSIDVVFAPAAVGRHVDHVLTNRACRRAFPQVILWADFPYVVRPWRMSRVPALGGVGPSLWDRDIDAKAELLQGYATQFPSLFPDGSVPRIAELFYVDEAFAFDSGSALACSGNPPQRALARTGSSR